MKLLSHFIVTLWCLDVRCSSHTRQILKISCNVWNRVANHLFTEVWTGFHRVEHQWPILSLVIIKGGIIPRLNLHGRVDKHSKPQHITVTIGHSLEDIEYGDFSGTHSRKKESIQMTYKVYSQLRQTPDGSWQLLSVSAGYHILGSYTANIHNGKSP